MRRSRRAEHALKSTIDTWKGRDAAMAVYQKTHRRTDNKPRRPFTADDAAFLAALQKELREQDTMCQAAPRFWAIAQTETFPAPMDDADDIIAVDNEMGNEYHTVQDVADFVAYAQDNGVDVEAVLSCHDMESAVETANETPGLENRLRAVGVKCRTVVVKDTLFLTHAACEDHLRKYAYNYKPDAHAFAMTATRSPEFEQLMEILEHADWTALRPSGT